MLTLNSVEDVHTHCIVKLFVLTRRITTEKIKRRLNGRECFFGVVRSSFLGGLGTRSVALSTTIELLRIVANVEIRRDGGDKERSSISGVKWFGIKLTSSTLEKKSSISSQLEKRKFVSPIDCISESGEMTNLLLFLSSVSRVDITHYWKFRMYWISLSSIKHHNLFLSYSWGYSWGSCLCFDGSKV